MRFTQVALLALVGLEGVYAGHPGNAKGHMDEGLVEHLIKPTYPKKTDTYANRARPLLPPSNKKGHSRRDLAPSLDGTCGGDKTCDGSPFGPCCSRDGWCGSSLASCGTGCREGYGTCESARLALRQATDTASDTASACDAPTDSATAAGTAGTQQSTAAVAASTTSSARPSSTSSRPAAASTSAAALAVSTAGRCGSAIKQTCKGSRFGSCCGSGNTCGSTAAFCSKTRGCQALYGTCT